MTAVETNPDHRFQTARLQLLGRNPPVGDRMAVAVLDSGDELLQQRRQNWQDEFDRHEQEKGCNLVLCLRFKVGHPSQTKLGLHS